MGVGWRKLAPLWALAVALACAQHTGGVQDLPPVLQGPSGDRVLGVTVLPPLRTTHVVRALNPEHNGRVCSTWGDFHYKTFDGDIFRFPGRCNYVFSAHCGAAYEDFNVQLRRGQESNATTVGRVTMKLSGMVLELTKGSVLVNGRPVQLPFSQSGVLVEHSTSYLKVVARLGLVFMWHQDNSLLLELDTKYANQTCGLCGDFNGIPLNEFFSHNAKLTPIEFGNLQKMDGPTEQCQDTVPEPPRNCSTSLGICEELLSSAMFLGCNPLVDPDSYVQACRQDLCFCPHTANPALCVCHTLAEYSRQCAHAGGLPPDWRSPDLCPQMCPLNMQYRECGSPCADTCSNLEHSQVCEDHCVAGCFCPEGTVFDDIGQTGCVPVSQCPCVYRGAVHAPGAVYSSDCTNCTCSGGRWSCRELPCPGTCSVLGGAHFSTFDERLYTVHGDCSYVLAKPCGSSTFTVLAELRRCGLTDSETCLRELTLSLDGGRTVVVVKASGEVLVNQIYTQLPVSAANITLFRPSTFFIIAQTNLGLQVEVQLVPAMQVFLRLAPQFRGLTCGLCGNFNQNQADDFRTLGGVVEGTAAAFANTWKTQAACPNVKNSFEDPCSLSVENEKYAQHWCSRLTDPQGPFAECHAAVNPASYYSNCLFDTCNCEKSEDCLCAALSAYVRACAARGVLLRGWRAGVCTKPMDTCPKSMTYHYNIDTCQPTCRVLSNEDVTCGISFVPVDGCTCPQGTFLDDRGKCVPAASCPCYHGDSVVPNGESLHERGAVCTCTQGTLTCIGGQTPAPVCAPPMVYFDCRNATPGDPGSGCQKSCHTLDMDCYSPQCVPGCVCPAGLVADGKGGCIATADCPCVHNEASYQAGQTIRVGCNTCTCKSRMWQCTDEPCLATCAVYGDGHYLTFDGQRYSFNGDCEYTLVQNHCGGNSSAQDAFRVVTENVPCGTTGTTCSKAIKIFLGSYELKLSDGKVEVIKKGVGPEVPYSIRQVGIYLVVDTESGLVLLWDKRTSIFLRLSPEFKGKVCGLCGNFDDNAINDFTTRSQSVVGDALEFGNSWKVSPSCPDAPAPRDPCTANPYRKSWAQKQCSLINSATFGACHAHVEPAKYYEACVNDACACDSGGDCECFCTAVAAYAQACREVGVCVPWRSPEVCPLFCDYYNPEGQCQWHYQPCGAPCMRTCRNPRGHCLHDTRSLEGCYPKCPPEAPIFDEDNMQCVATCPSPPPPPPCQVQGKSYRPGAVVPSDRNCHSCICTENGVRCVYDTEACVCTYDGRRFRPGDVIYHTTDGTGGCISARCGVNGTIERSVHACSSSTPIPPTTFSFSTLPVAVSSTGPPITSPGTAMSPATTGTETRALSTSLGTSSRPKLSMASVSPGPGCGEECQWSSWLDVSRPGRGVDSGDFDTLDNLRVHGYQVCQAPRAVECQAEGAPGVPLQALGQRVECSPTVGLVCYNRDQVSGLCDNYQIRVLCCTPRACSTSSGPATVTPPATNRTTKARLTPGTTSVLTESSTVSPSPVTTTGPTMSSTTSRIPAPGTSAAVRRTLSTSGPRPVSTTSASVSTTPPGPSEVPGAPTSSGASPISCLQERCTWTGWVDASYPQPGINSGDFDTFQNLRSKGYTFCERPSKVECRAEHFPDTPLALLGQDVVCNNQVGLVCLNRNQLPPICYNYQIRIQCCEWVDVCRETTVSSVTPTEMRSTWSQVTQTAGVSSASTQHRGASSTQVPPTTKEVTPGTTTCRPQCTWTKWFDVDFPSPGPHGGDVETYSNIVRSGEKICRRPEYIAHLECRAENNPEVSIERLGQVVQCDADVGLVCHNRDQPGRFKMCFNYEVRVLCCEPQEGCPTSEPVTVPSTLSVSIPGPTETTSHLATSRTTFVPETSTTSVHRIHTTSAPETSRTPVPKIRTTSAPETSTTPVPRIRTTSAPETSTTPVPRIHTTSAPETSTTQVRIMSTTSAPVTTTTLVSAAETTQPTPGTTTCRPQCTWTKWFDVDFPSPGPHGGDVETYSNIVRSGEKICRRPEYIAHLECRAENNPEVSIERLGQVVQCDADVGLVCHNRDQPGRFKMCFNYEVRVLCCEPQEGCPTSEPVTVPSTLSVSIPGPTETTSHLATSRTTFVPETSTTSVHRIHTTSAPETSRTPVPKIRTTSAPETSTTPVPRIRTTSAPEISRTPVPRIHTTSAPETSTTQVRIMSTTSAPVTTTTLVSAAETTHATPGTTTCRPQCTWTKWFDVDFPSPGPHGGDVETYSNIVRSGEKICRRPEYIAHLECRAENHPEVSIERLGQVVQCDPDVGLVCHNWDQPGRFKMCFNYEVRVLCCEPQEGCPTSEPVTVPSTLSVSIPGPTETTSHLATSRTTFVPETSTTSVHRIHTTSAPETSRTPVPKIRTTSAPETSTTPVPRIRTTSAPEISRTPVPRIHTTSAPETSTTQVRIMSTTSAPVTTTTLVSAAETTHPTPGTTTCRPQCTWTKWFDVDFPSPGPHGGDVETYSNIVRSGEKICRRPEYIAHLECRAENHPEVSIERLGQVVQCDPDVGLVCHNRDQPGRFKMCFNYEVRVLCCEPQEGCPTSEPVTVPSTLSVSIPGPTETTSHLATSRTTFVPETSTTSVHRIHTTSAPETSRTPVPRIHTTSAPETSTTPVPRIHTTSAPETSRTPVPRIHTTSAPETSTTPVPRIHTTSASETRRTPVPRIHTSAPETSMTLVPRIRTTSAPETSRTPVPRIHTTSAPETSTTPVPRIRTTSAPETSRTLVPRIRTTSAPETSRTPVPRIRTTSAPETSRTLVPRIRTTSAPETSRTLVPRIRTTSAPETSRTLVPRIRTTSAPETSRTLVPRIRTTSAPETSRTLVPRIRTTSAPETSTTPVPRIRTTSAPETSRTLVPRIHTTSAPETSTTQVRIMSTTSAPVTTTTLVSAAETTQPTPGTTTCRPQCTWTKWFDVDFPSPGPHGGDVETYSNIVRSGEKICRRPEYIAHLECRAENHPEVSIERLGQVVQCDPDVGLVCHNRDQPGRFKMCFNYEVRVLCCEPQEGCPTSEPVTVPSTLSVSIPGPTETTSHLATSRTTFVPETSTTSVHRIHTTSAPETSRTPVPRIHTTSAPETSTTLVPRIHTTSAPETSRTPVPRIRTTSAPETSTTPVPRIRTTSAPETSTTQVRIMSTTSAPVTTTTLVSAAETTHPTPGTTTCRPQCTWTKWFDVDFPSPGPHGGDVETYSNIVRSGEKICRRPEYIAHLECRAENHPEVSIERLGQVVQCDADVGLVCHNRDQPGRFKMCFNYEVRVLCCEPQDGCPTSEIPYMTSSAGSPPTTDFISVVPTLSSPSTPVSSTPACYCSVADKLYPAGSIIYQQADLAGHCYYAVCSVDCHVLRQTGHACPTSASPPTPPTSPAGSSSSAPVPVTTQGCPNAVPPRTRGETWAMPNCSQATCEGNNVITLQPRPCPSVQEPTCANGYPAVKVADEDGCCLHYQCQCVCSGWGDPHYITFDGTYYTFLDNCTYVLVQQIVPVYGHFRVLVDNYFCDAEDGLSCPQSIVVEYRQDRVVLTRKPVRGVMTNEIIFNNKVVSPGFGKDGILVSQIGIKMYVTIPEIGVQVLFTGLVFSVAVPFSKFANNTEGQCGTCTNDPKDDCRLPGGAVVTSCSDMSVHWKVPNPDQPSCHGPPPTAPAVWTTTPPTPCPPSPICQLILSDVFKLCHAVIPPRPYFEGCVFDQCHMTNADVVCSGLELYASLCASHGVCIDWRGQTNHTCPFTCPADKVYRPCGPTNPSFCYGSDSISLMVLQDAGPVMEGCFCPEGMTPFSSTTEVCVPVGCPRCLGPHGEPVEPGHTVSFNCQECTCEGGTWTMTCRPHPCPPPPACPEPGLVPVPVAPHAGLCCPQYTCACNTSYCPTLVGCPEGTRQSLTYEDGACCPHQHCSWTVCSVNGTLYQPGAVVSSSLCETCRCELPGGPPSDTFRISCETQTCNTHCPVGFEYQAQSGQCCGACVQVACVMNTSDSSAHLFYPGESWSDPGNRCETHECERHQNGLVVVTTKKACPPLSCPVDQAVLSKDRCCLTCPQPQPQNKSTCAVYHKDQVIRVQGCSSEGAVRLTYCRGNCGDTTSMYSLEANSLEHQCRCCQELRTSPRDVTLRCADGSRRAFSYTQVEECGCVGQHCEAQDDRGQLQEQGPLQSQDTEGLRRRGAEAQASPLA